MIDPVAVQDVMRDWKKFREDFVSRSGAVTQAQIQEFADTSNALGSKFMSAMDCRVPEMLETIGELAMQAATMLRNPEAMQ